MWFELYDWGGVSLLGVKSALAQSRTKEGLIDACVHLANISRRDRDRQRIVSVRQECKRQESMQYV